MGVIAAALGMALAAGESAAAGDIAFYAANHLLVKSALFLDDWRARRAARHCAALALVGRARA